MHAALGGSPGYRALSPREAPQSVAEFDEWVADSLLNPGQALFSRSEAEYLLREDPNFSGSTLHYGIINAVARGASSPAKIGGLLERDRTTLARPLTALIDAGYLRHDNDPLTTRRPVITIADPIIRFHNLITVAQTSLVESGRAAQAWQEARNTFAAQILGPHFESCARDWLRRHAVPRAAEHAEGQWPEPTTPDRQPELLQPEAVDPERGADLRPEPQLRS
jgi:hypothetical protein